MFTVRVSRESLVDLKVSDYRLAFIVTDGSSEQLNGILNWETDLISASGF